MIFPADAAPLGVIGGLAAVDALLAAATGEDARLPAQAAKAFAQAVDSDLRAPAIPTRRFVNA